MSAPSLDDLVSGAGRLLDLCRARRLRIATAESCTGGLIAATLTEVAGSSDVFDRGFVTYSNEAKSEMLGVPAALIASHGAVSREVAEAMAKGALAASDADIAVAVTGIAGPGGGSTAKPVGLVHLSAAHRGGAALHREMRYGDIGRAAIRRQSAADALRTLEKLLDEDNVGGG